jgi:dUTP pyrophosphatase
MFYYKKFHKGAIAPSCANPRQDLGYDIFFCPETEVETPGGDGTETANITASGGEIVKLRTGIGVEVTNMATGFLIHDRSSMAAKGLHVIGGVIDAGYRGEITVVMVNLTKIPYTFRPGDKIAQMIPIPTLTAMQLTQIAELGQTDRGSSGFGSTGR